MRINVITAQVLIRVIPAVNDSIADLPGEELGAQEISTGTLNLIRTIGAVALLIAPGSGRDALVATQTPERPHLALGRPDSRSRSLSRLLTTFTDVPRDGFNSGADAGAARAARIRRPFFHTQNGRSEK